MPLTLGYNTREDLPFYYAFADAFTVCDQNFCSSLTGTTPNRLHLWTGSIRAKASADSPALVRNEDCDYGAWVSWTTFPERLEGHGVSWKIYQNELTVPSGLTSEADAWLANFGDSPIEWFTQFHVRFAATHREFLEKQIKALPKEIEALKKRLPTQAPDQQEKLRQQIADLSAKLASCEKDRAEFSPENFDKLSAREKNLHARAFCTNIGDPAYRELVDISYKDGDATRRLKVPKGDLLHQFRKDVEGGILRSLSLNRCHS
jgi:phospholipase C